MHVERQDGGTSPKCDRAALEVPSNHMQLVLHLARLVGNLGVGDVHVDLAHPVVPSGCQTPAAQS